MARIGIYGGTFNPIHNTHIEIAKAALEQFNLDRVYFLIAGTPPHKDLDNAIADTCRLEMAEIALKDYPNFAIDDREIYRSGKSYSYISLTEYKQEHPYDELFFIMGSDSLISFQKWFQPEVISEYATIIVAPRLDDDISKVEKAISQCQDLFNGDFILLNFAANSVSSTEIRDCFIEGIDTKDIPEEVKKYILEHNLYSRFNYNNDEVRKLDSCMLSELKTNRYLHTIGVANMAYALAIAWNYPATKAMIAGMLHDCAKCISDEKRISVCEKHNIPITDIEYQYPHLLHGKVGAFYCKEKYNILDPQIAHAIEVHTTGCPDMSLLDRIIFVADYIEPSRDKQPRLDILRATAFSDLDLCVYMILEDSVNYLNSNPDMVDPTTIDTYNFYKKVIEER